MITRRQTIATLAAGAVAAPAVLRAQSPTTWIVYTYVPAATLAPAKVFQEIIERVAKETNGGFQLKYHLGGALTIKATDITTAVGDNIVQIGDDGFQQGNVPITGILRLPMLITNTAEFEKALARMAVGTVAPVDTRYGLHIVALDRRIEGRDLPFELVRVRIAEWMDEKVRRGAIRQYVSILAGRADIQGIDLDASASPLVQ